MYRLERRRGDILAAIYPFDLGETLTAPVVITYCRVLDLPLADFGIDASDL